MKLKTFKIYNIQIYENINIKKIWPFGIGGKKISELDLGTHMQTIPCQRVLHVSVRARSADHSSL